MMMMMSLMKAHLCMYQLIHGKAPMIRAQNYAPMGSDPIAVSCQTHALHVQCIAETGNMQSIIMCMQFYALLR